MATAGVATQDDFDSRVTGGTGLVIVDFWATWCGPCKQMAPVFEALASELAGEVTFLKVDVDEAPALAERFELRSVPTLVVLSDGVEVARAPGGGRAQIVALLERSGFTSRGA